MNRHRDVVVWKLEDLDDGADLPHAFVHPDFVPANAITTPDDHRVIVDWAGAGNGPRLWSLAFLLWAGGVRDLRLVDGWRQRPRGGCRRRSHRGRDQPGSRRLGCCCPLTYGKPNRLMNPLVGLVCQDRFL